MAEAMQDDLAWDYTADECSPLLRRAVSPHSRRDRPVSLTQNQIHYVLHHLGEATQILSSQLVHRVAEDGRTTETVSATQTSSTLLHKIYSLYRRAMGYAPVLIILLQIITVVIETIIDGSSEDHSNAPHRPFTSAVFVSISAVIIILFYVYLLIRIFSRRVTLVTLLLSFLASSIFFANVYTVFYRFSADGWGIPGKVFNELFIVTFLRMVHVSFSVFTLCNDASGTVVVTWYPLTVFSIQMLIAYFHFIIIVATVLNLLFPHSTNTVPNHAADYYQQQQTVREPDTESISFGTILAPVIGSFPIANNRNVPMSGIPDAENSAELSRSI